MFQRVFMIRPWKVVLPVVLGLALLPGAAMAQGETTAPTITIVTPAQGATYTVGQTIEASFSCTDASGISDCIGTAAHGARIDTAAVGPHTFTVTAKDNAGNTASETRTYSVEPVTVPVGGETPATLNLTLGSPASFSPFIPGLSRDYSTSMTASVTSTAENAALTVADPSGTSPGRLVNGAFSLLTPLQAGAVSTYEYALKPMIPMGNVGTSAAPFTLLNYNGPVGLDTVTLNFKQSIAETEALRTGAYAKTLTFTLSTTSP
jgi:hypothetical protein